MHEAEKAKLGAEAWAATEERRFSLHNVTIKEDISDGTQIQVFIKKKKILSTVFYNEQKFINQIYLHTKKGFRSKY